MFLVSVIELETHVFLLLDFGLRLLGLLDLFFLKMKRIRIEEGVIMIVE